MPDDNPEPEPLPIVITVATVTYNADTLLEQTIFNIEQQDYPYIEHVIIDGNSGDNTLNVIHEYQKRNSLRTLPRTIQALSEVDNGIYDAMNKALTMATGNYIIFMNAGDTFYTKHTVCHVANLAHHSLAYSQVLPGVLYGDTCIVSETGQYVGRRHLSPPKHLSWKSFKKGMMVCHQAFFANTALTQDTLYNLRYQFSADFDWCIRIMQQAERQGLPLCNTQENIAQFVTGGTTTKHHKESLRERMEIMCHYYGTLPTLIRHIGFALRASVRTLRQYLKI